MNDDVKILPDKQQNRTGPTVGNGMGSDQDKQESRAVARKSCDATAVLFGLKFADNIHYNFKNSQASKAMLHTSKHTVSKRI